MIKLFSILVLLLSAADAYPQYKMIRTSEARAFQMIEKHGFVTEHSIPILDSDKIYWEGPVREWLIDSLERDGIGYEIVPSFLPQKTTDEKLSHNGFELGEYAGHFYLEEIYQKTEFYCQAISNAGQITLDIDTIGFTRESRPIIAYHLTPNNTKEIPNVLISSLMHAREAVTATTFLYFLHHELKSIEEGKYSYLDDNRLTLIPVYNPDGYHLNQTQDPQGGGLVRKNVWYEDGELMGTDLNRNFGPFDLWAYGSDYKKGEIYHGESPFSEPETKAIDSLTTHNYYQLQIHLHSWGNVVLHPEYHEPFKGMEEMYSSISKESQRTHGFMCGADTSVLNYKCFGDIVDYMSLKYPRSIVVLPELGNQMQGFWPPIDEIGYILENGYEIISDYIEIINNRPIIEDFPVKDEMYITDSESRLFRDHYVKFDEFPWPLDSVYDTHRHIVRGVSQAENEIINSINLVSMSTESDRSELTLPYSYELLDSNRRQLITYDLEYLVGMPMIAQIDSLVSSQPLANNRIFSIDSFRLQSFPDNSIRLYINQSLFDAMEGETAFQLKLSANWRTRTWLDMVSIKAIGSDTLLLKSPYMIDGIYPEEWWGYHQKKGLAGYHSWMDEEVSDWMQFTTDQAFDYIEFRYHTNEYGAKEDFHFSAHDIVLARYIRGDFSSVEEKDDIPLNGILLNKTYSVTGSLVSKDEKTLEELVKSLQDGIYIAESADQEFRIVLIIRSQELVSYRILP